MAREDRVRFRLGLKWNPQLRAQSPTTTSSTMVVSSCRIPRVKNIPSYLCQTFAAGHSFMSFRSSEYLKMAVQHTSTGDGALGLWASDTTQVPPAVCVELGRWNHSPGNQQSRPPKANRIYPNLPIHFASFLHHFALASARFRAKMRTSNMQQYSEHVFETSAEKNVFSL